MQSKVFCYGGKLTQDSDDLLSDYLLSEERVDVMFEMAGVTEEIISITWRCYRNDCLYTSGYHQHFESMIQNHSVVENFK